MDHGAPLGAWGEAPSGRVLDPKTEAFARARLGEPLAAPGPSETAGRGAGQTVHDNSALTPERMHALFPGVEWSLEASMRARFSRGMSYLNLMSWRAGEAPRLPDAVVFPTSHQDVLDVLAGCSAQGIAVVPVGGGTSVTGGVDTPDLDAVVVCSLDRMSEVQNLDTESGIVTVQAGATGPQLESYLNERGWTLGHFPQSFERAT
ncbi:MAG: FAD-binding oxidoreductase, partial [Candidatus Nanopelagicales bacterium]